MFAVVYVSSSYGQQLGAQHQDHEMLFYNSQCPPYVNHSAVVELWIWALDKQCILMHSKERTLVFYNIKTPEIFTTAVILSDWKPNVGVKGSWMPIAPL